MRNKRVKTHCTGSAALQNGSSLVYKNSDSFSNEMTEQQSNNFILHNSASSVRPEQDNPEISGFFTEYIVGEDDDDGMISDPDWNKLSSNSGSDDETLSASSGDTSNSSDSECGPEPGDRLCSECGGGPYKSLRLHLRQCTGAKRYQCVLCKDLFSNEAELQEHHMPLYLCNSCGQVFPKKVFHSHSHCPKPQTSLVLFCSEMLPKACNICKSFFVSKKLLLAHVTKVHSSVVSTKVCIITNPSLLTDEKKLSGVLGTQIQSGVPPARESNQVVNGNVSVGWTHEASLSNSFPFLASEHRPSSASPVDQPSLFLPSTSSPAPNAINSDHDYSSTATVLALFENKSRQLALMKRMNSSWRSKPPHPCRQCGAILRQPSFFISHRYLHRGRRSHRCWCGRDFKHQLHLLRHCLQHAEALSYICVSCGDTFTGAKRFAKHLVDKVEKKSHRGQTIKRKVKKKCGMPFICECGLRFFSPSAYLWHQIKNKSKIRDS
ncbi:zinc finger protein 27-like [Nothobranchius furzeri]|uniref:Zinc finger protein 27-like n=1 Tax=Nothobranchius furzeri TaxID=105023 RepID=A0A9D2XBM7_NOTFU|nr:zinc finger protein 27-like [Nothobranchius furzeri]